MKKYLRSKIFILILSGLVVFILVWVGINALGVTIKNTLIERSVEQERANLPPAVNYSGNTLNTDTFNNNIQRNDQVIIKNQNNSLQVDSIPADPPETTPVPAPVTPLPFKKQLSQSTNLNVPFTSQAPSANWDLLFKEACEEASIIMVDKFYKGQSFQDASATEDEIKKVVEFEEQKLGFHLDTNAEQTVQVLKDYFGYTNVRAVYDITVDDIKKELDQGRPVIIPAAGRMLGNPYYRQPGPLYHMLVVKGYTQTKFITNDPGTRRGKDFTYSFDTFYNAIHDWNNGNVENGRKAMIVVDP